MNPIIFDTQYDFIVYGKKTIIWKLKGKSTHDPGRRKFNTPYP